MPSPRDRNCEALRGSQFHGGHGLPQPTMVQRGQGTGRCSTYPLPEFFYAIYHKRSNVESTNTSPKRLFPAELRSEEFRRQRGPVQGDSLQSGSFREGNEDVWDQARLPCGGLVARRGGPWVVRSARAESCAGGLVPWESSCRICSKWFKFPFFLRRQSPRWPNPACEPRVRESHLGFIALVDRGVAPSNNGQLTIGPTEGLKEVTCRASHGCTRVYRT